jgi:hypothetical protein
MPKHHRTFGRPNLYEQVSQEIDHRSDPMNRRKQLTTLTLKRDRIIVDVISGDVKVIDEFG